MIFLVLFVVDKIIKILILNSGGMVFINNGLLFGIPVNPTIILIIETLTFILLSIYSRKIKNLSLKIIAFGAFMNITDRIFWGGVVDYFNVFNILFINIADVIILMGIFYLIYSEFIVRKNYSFKSK